MNKLIAFVLCFLLIFGTVPYVLAETAVTNTDVEDPYSTLNLVKQLRENPLVEDIWVPVLPEYYKIKGIEITPNGSYTFSFNKPSLSVMLIYRISIIYGKGISHPSD